MVRMEWTFDEFFAGGGTTTFMDRVAGSLGIHASTIKIVSVYEGSLVVNYAIENDDPAALETIQEAQTQQFATGAMDLGAPILDVQASVTSDSSSASASSSAPPVSIVTGGVVTAPGFDPIVITNTGSSSSSGGADGSKEVFIPTVPIVQQNTTTYRNVTVTGEKALETNNTSIIVIAASAGIILLVAIAFALRVLYMKIYHEKIQKEAIKTKQLEVTLGKVGTFAADG